VEVLRAVLIPGLEWRDKMSYRNMVRVAVCYELEKHVLRLYAELLKKALDKLGDTGQDE
jgi:hypothetical protein